MIVHWKISHINKVYNIHRVPDTPFQWYGAVQLYYSMTIYWVFGSILYQSGLGWWLWNLLWGKSVIIMREYNFYQPPDNVRYFGSNLNQHHRYYAHTGKYIFPHQDFWGDIQA